MIRGRAAPQGTTVAGRAALALCAVAWVASSTPARACDIPSPRTLQVEQPSAGVPGQAPSQVDDVGVAVWRGRGPVRVGCSSTSASCDELGMVSLAFPAPADLDSSIQAIGYRFEVTRGHAPEGLLPRDPEVVLRPTSAAVEGVRVDLPWVDDAEDDQEPLDFELSITAVDEDGNAGQPSDPVAVRDGGSRDVSCGVQRGGRSRGALLLFGVLLIGLLRLKRSAAPVCALNRAGAARCTRTPRAKGRAPSG